MPSENYRCYRLDGVGRPYEAEWFYAESDEAAVAQIEEKHPDARCEIWQQRRLVANLPKRLPA